MLKTRVAARVLSILCGMLCFGYLLTVVYAVFCITTGISTAAYGEGRFLHILYPFSRTPFLNIDNNSSYIIFSFLLPLTLYGIFFGLSTLVFRVFIQPKWFTAEHVKTLQLFYVFNILVPSPAAIIAGFFVPVESMVWALVFVHFLLGVLAFFLAAIFEQGLHLQNERDLFI